MLMAPNGKRGRGEATKGAQELVLRRVIICRYVTFLQILMPIRLDDIKGSNVGYMGIIINYNVQCCYLNKIYRNVLLRNC